MVTLHGSGLKMNLLREYIREIIREGRKTSSSGSHPDQRYVKATDSNLFLDRPTSHGGWPEGEYDPPVRKRISSYLKSLGLLESDDDDE